MAPAWGTAWGASLPEMGTRLGLTESPRRFDLLELKIFHRFRG